MKQIGTNFILETNHPDTSYTLTGCNDVYLDRMNLSFYGYQANHDSFCRLELNNPEYQQFIHTCEALMQHKSTYAFTMVVFDIDSFHEVNDLYGHSAGNDLLYYIQVKLASNIHAPNHYCRLYDDHFAIFLENYSEVDTALLVIHLTEEISGYYPELQLKLSFGICTAGSKVSDTSSLYERALYAKNTIKGKSQLLANYNEILNYSNIIS